MDEVSQTKSHFVHRQHAKSSGRALVWPNDVKVRASQLFSRLQLAFAECSSLSDLNINKPEPRHCSAVCSLLSLSRCSSPQESLPRGSFQNFYFLTSTGTHTHRGTHTHTGERGALHNTPRSPDAQYRQSTRGTHKTQNTTDTHNTADTHTTQTHEKRETSLFTAAVCFCLKGTCVVK